MPAACYRRESSTETPRTTGVRIERTTATDVNGEDKLAVGSAIKRAPAISSSAPRSMFLPHPFVARSCPFNQYSHRLHCSCLVASPVRLDTDLPLALLQEAPYRLVEAHREQRWATTSWTCRRERSIFSSSKRSRSAPCTAGRSPSASTTSLAPRSRSRRGRSTPPCIGSSAAVGFAPSGARRTTTAKRSTTS